MLCMFYLEKREIVAPLGFNDNIYHEGNISRLPDFDVFFSLLDKRNNRSHGKRKNGI